MPCRAHLTYLLLLLHKVRRAVPYMHLPLEKTSRAHAARSQYYRGYATRETRDSLRRLLAVDLNRRQINLTKIGDLCAFNEPTVTRLLGSL